MVENTINERLLQFRKNLSKCVNVTTKQYTNKELILSHAPIKKRIGFITYGKAFIIKTDIDGNTTIMRELKENDIFSNLFFQNSEDEINTIIPVLKKFASEDEIAKMNQVIKMFYSRKK